MKKLRLGAFTLLLVLLLFLPMGITSDVPFANVPFDVTNIPEPVPPPKEVRDFFDLDPFYQQWINVEGYPVLASAKVSPYAVKETAWQIKQMIGHRTDILKVLAQKRVRFSIIAHNEVRSDLPEFRDQPLHFYYDVRQRGGAGWPTFGSEEQAFNSGSVNIHEVAHTIHGVALNQLDPTFDNRLKTLFNAATAKGLWHGVAPNYGEYWAEAVTVWFHVAQLSPLKTREALKAYDPDVALLITEVFGDNDYRYTPIQMRTHLPHLQGFDLQSAPREVEWTPGVVEAYEELRNPAINERNEWVNLPPYDTSLLPRLNELRNRVPQVGWTHILVANIIDAEILFYWVNPDGTETLHYRFPPKPWMIAHFQCRVGDLLLAKDSTGRNIAVFQAVEKTGRVLVAPNLHLITPGISKVSGDNQAGVSGAVLANPFVVEMREENLSTLEGISVTFTLTAGDGTLSVTHTMTDKNGRAESTLTLGPNQGTNTVSVSAIGIAQPVTFNAVAESAIDIPGLHFRTAIEIALGKAAGNPITPSEMATLPRLEAPNANISDLTGLEYATNLTELFLGNEYVEAEGRWINSNSVSNLSPLAGLTQLRTLILRSNNITDISALAELANLTRLWADNNNISDISALAGLANLTSLNLGGNNITDISLVAGLTNLIELWLGYNSITDIPAVVKLTNLTALGLQGNNISDLSFLSGLTNLKTLRVEYNSISDLSPLVANTGLGSGDTVYVQGNRLSYQSIHTHIPTLQSRGVTVEFDNRIPTPPLKISGDDQRSTPSSVLKKPLVVKVQDGSSVPFEGVPVTFTVTAGGGTLSATSVTTDSNGKAETTLTLGPNPVTNTVEVTVTGIEEKQTFSAEGIRIPKTLEISSGVDQEGLPGEALEKPFVVEVRDEFDKPLPGAQVTFTVTSGGGTLSETSVTTNSIGRAETILTLGPNPGTNTVTVSVAGSQETRTFNAEGIRIPKTLEIISGKDQEGLPGDALEKAFVVEVRDQTDKPLPGVEVTFTVTAGGGKVQPEIATTDESGRAESTLTLGPNPGTNTVEATVTGIEEKRTFTAEGNRIPKTLEIISGVDQEGLPGEALGKPFVVEVQDQTDNPLPGVEVTFSVTAGDGTLSATHATTDENGRAESTLTLGSTPGTNTVRVSVEGNTQAVATLTIETVRVFALSIPAGTHLIHIPLAVNQINGEDATIETVGDLYNALGDAVNYIITVGDDGGWKTYLGDLSAGSAADAAIGDDTGLVVVMSDAKTLELVGDALGAGGNSMINIDVGNNLVGLPLQPEGMSMISDLLGDGVGAIAVSKADGMGFHTIREPGQDGDGPLMGGVGYLVVYTGAEATSIPIVGSAWENSGAVSAAPAVAFDGSQTPVLYVEGGVMDEFNMLARAPELRVTVKNLSTGASLDTVLGTELSATAYSATFVELSRHAAKAGDVLEIVAHAPNPFVGVRPVPQIVVSAEEVLTSRISLPDLELYEIPSESELLANYPNPFNPETWIPYRLAKAAEVTLDIYDATGRLVRSIDVGFKPAAVYESRASAIYWDGRNNQGESVASGVYFYHLSAGDYSATRKMLILK